MVSGLFDVVPQNFFQPLTSPSKIAYWECIQRLFTIMAHQLSFGIEREILVNDLEEYFGSQMAAQIIDTESGTVPANPRDKANMVLRYLESCGWIYTDVDHNYVQRTNFRDYAVTIIRTLQDVSENRKPEYQGYIYTIYDLVRADDKPGIHLREIVKNTNDLITGLKTLNANIKRYIDDLTKHQTVQEIMDALLTDYYENVVDRAYHRLVTSDNVSRYRPEIIERLEADARSEEYVRQASREIAEMEDIPPEDSETARERVFDYLHEVITDFRQLDEIIEEISAKNTRYQRAAISRAQFLLANADDVRGQLRDIIGALANRMQAESLDPRGIYELEETDRLIHMFSFTFLDMESLYKPIEGKKTFMPQIVPIQPVDEATRRRNREAMQRKLDNVLSPQKIDAFVEQCLGDRDRMNASDILHADIPVNGGTSHSETDLFIRIIYIRLYGSRQQMRYSVEPKEKTEVDGFRFRDFTITRRKD